MEIRVKCINEGIYKGELTVDNEYIVDSKKVLTTEDGVHFVIIKGDTGYEKCYPIELFRAIENHGIQAYIGGDMLLDSSVIARGIEGCLLELLGVNIHSPKDDKEINDKSNQTVESNNGLAEKIVAKDTKGIIDSDIIVIEPAVHAIGTMCEVAQIKGMKDAYKMIYSFFEEHKPEVADTIYEVFNNKFNKKVYAHYGDMRRTDIPEVGDRRSWGINQYLYGLVLDITNGKGFMDKEEILKAIAEEVCAI